MDQKIPIFPDDYTDDCADYAAFSALIAANIVRHRKAKRMGRARLAKKAGLAPAILSAIEAGKCEPTLYALYRIARALGAPLAVLVVGARARRY